MDETHVPLLGNVKKPYLYAGIGGIAIIGGIAYWRHQAAAAANAQTATDTATADPNAIDPSTGQPYSAEQMMGGSYPSYPYGVSDYGGGGYPYSPPPVSNSSSSISTNADWATEVENALLANDIPIATSSTAISRVLAGLTVTTAQQAIFMQGVGLFLEPPQGYPKPIKLTDTPAQPGPSATVTVPNVVGKNFGQAFNMLTVANLTSDPGHGGTHADWTVTAQSVKAGSKVKEHTVVHLTVPQPKAVKK